MAFSISLTVCNIKNICLSEGTRLELLRILKEIQWKPEIVLLQQSQINRHKD